MKKTRSQQIDDIFQDESLRTYFIDYICENMKLTYGQIMKLPAKEQGKFLAVADEKGARVKQALAGRVLPKDLNYVFEKTCLRYAGLIGVASDNTGGSQELRPFGLIDLFARRGAPIRFQHN
ncbi:MAG: hypothetical protein O9311_08170 [Cytophagales bacterium]|nr:hypothetical protein [Cytophagales bacterium]